MSLSLKCFGQFAGFGELYISYVSRNFSLVDRSVVKVWILGCPVRRSIALSKIFQLKKGDLSTMIQDCVRI